MAGIASAFSEAQCVGKYGSQGPRCQSCNHGGYCLSLTPHRNVMGGRL